MLTENRWALKEWAGVCAGLATGKSCLILRKGGIREEHDQFLPEHEECWLYPTQFHQTIDQFGQDFSELSEQKFILPAISGTLQLQIYAEIVQVFQVGDTQILDKILPYQLLSRQVIHQRFDYKAPGLCGLILKCHQINQPVTLPELNQYAGCKSWVELTECVSTKNLIPVLEESRFVHNLHEINRILTN